MRSLSAVLLLSGLLLLDGCGQPAGGDGAVDTALLEEINRLPAIDNHAHPMKVVGRGEQDHDYDALPGDAISDSGLPAPFQPGNQYFPQAFHALFGTPVTPPWADQVREAAKRREEIQQQKGDLYPSWVLNQAKTDVMLANRVAMGRGLPQDRFKWVPFVDMFLLPLNNSALKNKDPEHASFVASEELLLKRYLSEGGASQIPASLDDYLRFLSHTLSSWRSSGAVAVKFEFAYLRDLQIGNPPRESAQRVYAIYAQSSEPTPEDYKLLQDFLFRYLSLEAGRLGLPVHIHCSIGAGSYFQTSNANPLALESLFNDPALRRTKFVMLHGGWPLAAQAAALTLKPNVYVDTSALAYLAYPAEAAKGVRLYLESAPEKVLYGSDASPFSKDVGWEETAWLGSDLGRRALAIALTGMMRDGEISRDKAREYAHMVLRENAHRLYGF